MKNNSWLSGWVWVESQPWYLYSALLNQERKTRKLQITWLIWWLLRLHLYTLIWTFCKWVKLDLLEFLCLFTASLAESQGGQTMEVDTSGNKEEAESNTSGEISPEKKQPKQRRKTKAELKAELKEQKVMERRSRRQRIRNKRYNYHQNLSFGTDGHEQTMQTQIIWTMRRLRSAWASTESDQNLRCLHEESVEKI